MSFRSKTLIIIRHTEDKRILNIMTILQKARYISINVFDQKLTFYFLKTSNGFLRLRPQTHHV